MHQFQNLLHPKYSDFIFNKLKYANIFYKIFKSHFLMQKPLYDYIPLQRDTVLPHTVSTSHQMFWLVLSTDSDQQMNPVIKTLWDTTWKEERQCLNNAQSKKTSS